MTDTQAAPERELTDLADRAGVEALLWRFYSQVIVDEVLAEPFTQVREVGLANHIPVMANFWETMLFHRRLYRGRVLDVHGYVHDRTPLSNRHFIRWLTMWKDTVDEMYSGPTAEQAKVTAARIAWSMHRALTSFDSEDLNAVVALSTRLPQSPRLPEN